MGLQRGAVCSLRKMLLILFAINFVITMVVVQLYTIHRKKEFNVNIRLMDLESDATNASAQGTKEVQTSLTVKVNESTHGVPDCNILKPEELVGIVTVDYSLALNVFRNMSYISEADVKARGEMFLGSSSEGYPFRISNNIVLFEPTECKPTHNVAFIIPFRNREGHLRLVLGHLIPILQRQKIRFAIFVVTQIGDQNFNKGRLMNTGFQFANDVGKARGHPFDCYVFHDVDLFAEHDTLQYRCTGGKKVDHFSYMIDKFEYKPFCCGMTVGGVIAFTEHQYRKVNGYSNKYWGWGAEDDDMANRIKHHGFVISRPQGENGKFKMMTHGRDKLNPVNTGRFKILWDDQSMLDGLGTLETHITSVTRFPLFVNVFVDVGKPP